MRYIDRLNNNPRQRTTIITEAGQSVAFTLRFVPTQAGWLFGIEYNDFVLNNSLLTLAPNILRSYRNLLPFGMLVLADDAVEPQFIDDFITGRVKIYTLTPAEVVLVETEFFS